MTLTIHKYQLAVCDKHTVEMPLGAEILCVQVQNDIPCLWAKVDPKAHRVDREIRIYGTGHDLDWDTGDYVGTFQVRGDFLVFHVFIQPEGQ